MARVEPKPLYSMRRLERDLGVNRTRLIGRVEALGIPTYGGPRGSVAIDDAGRAMLLENLGLPAAARD